MRTIVVGDVHGCFTELCELLKLVSYNQFKDKLYFVGDLINRGPASKDCIELLHEYKAISVMGNHEYYLLQAAAEKEHRWSIYAKMQLEFGAKFGQLLEDLAKWPYFLDLPEMRIIHAGVMPGVNVEDADRETLLNLREVPDPETGEAVPWFELYKGERTIVFGHWARLNGVIRKNAIGIDRGCVYGRKLRCVIFPEREIAEVDAKEIYYQGT